MSEHDPDRIDRRILDAWEIDPPPEGFVDRVIDASRAPARRRGRTLWIAAAGALGIAAAIALLVWPRGRAARGELSATERTSILLDGRGVAVAEAGADLSWSVDARGAARVDQRAGDVFYRVEPGGSFVVETALGRVQVRGTCFRVEVIPMRPSKSSLVGAGVGAALSAAVVVTVYEGKVLFANESGERAVAAGERSTIVPGSPPTVASREIATATTPPPSKIEEIPAPHAGATREELLERDRIQRDELARLRVRVRDLEATMAAGPKVRVRGRGPEAPFVDPTPEQLLEMARSCQVQWDSVPLTLDEQLGPQSAAEMGISEEERVAINKAIAAVSERVIAQLRALYIEVTGDTANAETLGPDTLAREIQDKSPRRDREEAMWRISQERAGLLAPPADLASRPPVERAIRLLVGVGDLFEQELARAIGKQRAHELRKADDGWPERHVQNGCPEDRPSLAPPKAE